MRTKILAVLVGPAGIGVFSILTNISTLFNSTFPIGTVGLNRYISQYFHEGKYGHINFLLRKFLYYNICAVVPLICVLIIFSEQISFWLLTSPIYNTLFIIVIISMPFSLVNGFIDVYLKGIRKINHYVVYSIINAVISLLVYVGLQLFFELSGAVIALLVSTVLVLVNSIIFLKKAKLFPDFKNIEVVEQHTIKNILRFGIASVIMLATQQTVLLFIRLTIVDNFTLTGLGLFQSVYSISTNYFGLFFSIIGIYSIPKISTFNTDNLKINTEINQTIKLLLLIYTPIIIISFVFKGFILTSLYSSDFLNAEQLVGFQFSGDLLKAVSWGLGLWLIPCVRIKEWLIFDLIYSLNYILTFYALINFFRVGLLSISIAYFIANGVHLIINYYFISKSLEFKFYKEVSRILISSLLFIFIIFFIGTYYFTVVYYIFIPILGIFVYLNVKKNDIYNIKEILKVKKTKTE